MQTFKQNLKLILAIALCSGISSVYAETEVIAGQSTINVQKNVDWPGLYLGLLPCADCYGVKTSLALNKNGTYILITQNLGKSPRDYVEKGKFIWAAKDNTIILTSKDNSSKHHYLVGEDSLTQLDNNSELITGKQAAQYVLRRTDVNKKSAKHAAH